MKISTVIKGSVYLLGLVGVSNFLITPAHADQAAARSAASVTRPSGVTESLSGEVLAPVGLYFQGIPGTPGTPGTPANPGSPHYNPGSGFIPVPSSGGTTTTCAGSPCYSPTGTTPFFELNPTFGASPAIPATPGTPGTTLTVAPTYANPGATNQSLTSLSFNAGTPTAVNTAGTIAGVVVDILQSDNAGVKAPTIDSAAAIIQAAAGANGLE
ncbi:MAG: hypothetical protein KME23_19015 [Goleter apudmare HA4340-LM2]|nr:hypothetical protein [Goleter apudmare HA4340-LM2]